MKKNIVVLTMLLTTFQLVGQNLSLDDCLEKAQKNYPLHSNEEFLEKSTYYNVSNALKMWLPNISLSGKASYQSDVTKMPIEIPNIDVPEIRKDQYKIQLEVSQTIFDGGNISNKTKILRAQNSVAKEQQNVNMYAINERVNQVFFGILVLDEQLKQNVLLQEDLKNTYNKVNVMTSNGVANSVDLDRVSVALLNAKQTEKQMKEMRQAYLNILGIYINQNLSNNTKLEKPQEIWISSDIATTRPELKLFDATQELYNVSEKALSSDLWPKLSAFVQGGYGNPALNMLEDEFKFYYVAGLRLSWNINSAYTNSNDKYLLQNSRNINEMNKQTFLFNNKLQALQSDAEITAIKKLIEDDEQIITLRENIRLASEKRTENGTMSVSDLITEINNLAQAKQNKEIHKIQLLEKEYNLKLTLGK